MISEPGRVDVATEIYIDCGILKAYTATHDGAYFLACTTTS